MKLNTPTAQQIMESGAIQIPKELYKGAGKAWAAIKNGEVVGLIYMDSFPEPTLHSLGRKRLTMAAKRALEIAEADRFAKHRTEARAELAQLGQVVSGTASGLQFYPKDIEAVARLANAVETGDPMGIDSEAGKEELWYDGRQLRRLLARGERLIPNFRPEHDALLGYAEDADGNEYEIVTITAWAGDEEPETQIRPVR